jgi:L-2-hydroxyglutarate oxidase
VIKHKAEVVICGAGIVGLTLARQLISQGASDIVLLEKERELGQHASGRNSGVLHAGIYYPADSLKAKLCLRGNILLKAYCKANGLPVLEFGKVVVAKNEGEREGLREICARAVANGATAQIIDEQRLAELEPYARTCSEAVYVHNTAVVDPQTILTKLSSDLIQSGKAQILTGVAFNGIKGSRTVQTTHGPIEFETFINAAGAYSDRVAHACGAAREYRLIPFKGTYKKLRPDRAFMVRGNIYPVPDLRNPFLGVHFTRTAHGEVSIGPTAIPAFGREHYHLFDGLGPESLRILYQDMALFFSNVKFRTVATSEPWKYVPRYFFEEAKALLKDLRQDDIEACEKVGIRPQLVDWEKKELVMDFLVLKDQERLHILNAISPAFTSSMAFAEYVVNEHLS